jgi:hypothetical protein
VQNTGSVTRQVMAAPFAPQIDIGIGSENLTQKGHQFRNNGMRLLPAQNGLTIKERRYILNIES